MGPILAQLSQPDAVHVMAFLGCAAFVVMLFNQFGNAWDRLKGKPPSSELKQTTDALEKRIADIEQFEKECPKEQKDQRRAIYVKLDQLKDCLQEKFNAQGESIARLEANDDTNRMKMAAMDGKLDRMLERLPHR